MKTIPPSWPGQASADPEILIHEARRRQRRRYLLTGLVVALVAAAVAAITPVLMGSSATTRTLASILPAREPVSYSSPPAYYANLIQGDIYDFTWQGPNIVEGYPYAQVRATATGKLLTTVRPPKPYNDLTLLSASANGRMFVFAARHYWQTGINPAPGVSTTPLKFLVLVITAGGRARLAELSLPGTPAPGQAPTIALSPDGTRLAEAFGWGGAPAVVRVITLATGQVREWVSPHVPWTPLIRGEGAWTADGRTLAFEELTGNTVYTPPSTTRVHLLDTTGPGTSLASARLLVLRQPAGGSAPWDSFITPDGARLTCLVGTGGSSSWRSGRYAGELAVYSARSGALLQILAKWTAQWPPPRQTPLRGPIHARYFPTQALLWSNDSGSQLLLMQPKNGINVLGMLTGSSFAPIRSDFLPQPAPQPTGG